MVVIDGGNGRGREVDVTELSVSLLQILQALAEGGEVEPLAVFHGELRAQGFYVQVGNLAVLEGDGAEGR